jgi:hypothetical protein
MMHQAHPKLILSAMLSVQGTDSRHVANGALAATVPNLIDHHCTPSGNTAAATH